jgi:cytoskeletal protein RodZ
MKKSLSVVFVLVLGLSMLLTACGGAQTETPTEAVSQPTEVAAATVEAPTEAPAATEAVEATTEAPAATEAATADTAVTADASAAGSTNIAAMEGATEMTADEKAAVDSVAAAVAKSAKLADDYSYEGWTLPAGTTWDTVLAYYDKQAATDGWTADAGAVTDIENGKVAAFTGANNSMLVLVYVQSADKVEALAVTGTLAK